MLLNNKTLLGNNKINSQTQNDKNKEITSTVNNFVNPANIQLTTLPTYVQLPLLEKEKQLIQALPAGSPESEQNGNIPVNTKSSTGVDIKVAGRCVLPVNTQVIGSPSYQQAKPIYSSILTKIIRLTPESMKCKLYCRGPTCKYCNSISWTKEQQSLNGIYSSWVTENILAMARPTNTSFSKFDLIRQFKENNICTIVNLQCTGEHSFCGPPLCNSGFTYDPEFLMQEKFYYYNFAIPDFETGSVEMIINIVKVLWFSLKNGKVAIHCHAGLGRTGTLIASYLVWSSGLFACDAINFVRHARPNSVQSSKQIDVVMQVECVIRSLAAALPYSRIVGGGFEETCKLPLSAILQNQCRALPNDEARKFSHVPKLIFLVCDRLLRLIFEEDGVTYKMPMTSNYSKNNKRKDVNITDSKYFNSRIFKHNVHNCTFGNLNIKWKNAFTSKGRAQVLYIINLFVRLTAFPYAINNELKKEFQHKSLIGIESTICQLNASQLVLLLNACMETIQRPYCSNEHLIKAIEWFSTHDIDDLTPEKSHSSSVKNLSAKSFIVANITPEEKERVNINKNWHCMVFYLLNVLSYLSGENYNNFTELITYWLTGDVYNDVKSAVYCHMHELFIRNTQQQKLQTIKFYKQVESEPTSSNTKTLNVDN